MMHAPRFLPALIGALCMLIGPIAAIAQETGTDPRDFAPK